MIRGIDRVSTIQWVVGVLILSNVIFAAAQVLSHRQVRYLMGEVGASRDRLSRAQLDRRHLFHRVASIRLEGEFLSGTDATTQDAVKIEDPPPSGVYYLMDSSCAVCPRNYGFLNDLAGQGVLVVGLSPKDELDALRDHVRQYELGALIVQGPTGALMSAIPQYGTPLTVVYRGATLVYLRGGVLNPEEQDVIRSLVSPALERR